MIGQSSEGIHAFVTIFDHKTGVMSPKARVWYKRAKIAAIIGVLVYFVYPYVLPDRVLMWETTSIDSGRASTGRATKAAKRFFDRAHIEGKTIDEIIAIAGHPKQSNDSIYNFPFHPVDPGTVVYRFDTGRSGWQFNIRFGADKRASHVEAKWIH